MGLAFGSSLSQIAVSLVVVVVVLGEVGRQKESLEGKGAIGAVAAIEASWCAYRSRKTVPLFLVCQ